MPRSHAPARARLGGGYALCAISLLGAACGSTTCNQPAGGPGEIASAPDATPATTAAGGSLLAFVSGKEGKIRVYSVDERSGGLALLQANATDGLPSFLAVDPARALLFAVDEDNALIRSFELDAESGVLTPINTVSAQGDGPAHLSLSTAGNWLLVANYEGGSVSVIPVARNGALGNATDTESPGARAHMAITDQSGAYAFVPCLGADLIAQYAFDSTRGLLEPNAVPSADLPANSGPRHLVFHPQGAVAFGINETASTITSFRFERASGRLTPIATASTLPEGYSGRNTGAEIAVHPTGRFVYGSNRGRDSIAVFSVDASSGKLSPLADVPSGRGDGPHNPRSFALSPDGHLLYAANQSSGQLVAFRIGADGKPVPLGVEAQAPGVTYVGLFRFPAHRQPAPR